MVDIWQSIKDTGESFAGAAGALPGAVIDIATMGFDDEDDDFGSFLSKMATRAGDVFDPILNPDTLTGAVGSKVWAAADWTLDNAVNRPISTAFTVASHTDVEGWDEAFDADSWRQAYDLSDTQNAGESFAFMFKDKGDPFDYADPYGQFAKEHPVAAPILSTTANVAGMWFLDPFALAGKASSFGRSFYQFNRLNEAQRSRILSDMVSTSSSGALTRNFNRRTDRYLDWIGGTNSQRRPLEGPEILHGTPELKKYAAEPEFIAGQLAEANKLDTPAARRDAQRRILAVAIGDFGELERLRAAQGGSAAIADQLTNMVKGGSIDLPRLAADPILRFQPTFVKRLETQLGNMDSTGDVQRFMDNWNDRLEMLVKSHRSLPNLPGVHTAGKRAVLRQNNAGKGRALSNAAIARDEWVAKRWSTVQSMSSPFQRSVHSLPLLAVRTVGLAGSVYTKVPVKITDALRQTHFTGVAHLHDWGGSTGQLDAMMRLSNVTPGDRMRALSEAYTATSEPEKLRVIARVEKLSVQSMAKHFAAKPGGEKIDGAYIEELMRQHAMKRLAHWNSIRGRSYAATDMPDHLRLQSAMNAEDAAMAAGDASKVGGGFGAKSRGKWRVDQINDDGVPLALPLLDTQLSNSVPMMDMGIARKLLERDNGYFSRLSHAWLDESNELTRLSGLKGSGARGLEKAIAKRSAARDWLVNAGQTAMRAWKFSVLFRLGYPMRVLMDDHWRIWTQMRALTFYGDNGREVMANWRWNRGARRDKAKEDLIALKENRQSIIDQLDGDQMVNYADRLADFKRANNSAGALRGHVTRLSREVREAQIKQGLGHATPADVKTAQDRLSAMERKVADADSTAARLGEELGDKSPDDLKRQIGLLEEQIKGGARGLRDPKRTVGTTPVKLGDGNVAEGAFAGRTGGAAWEASSSHASFETQLRGVEDRMFTAGTNGSHRTIEPHEPGHINAWADVLNYQFRNSPVAMHFVKGGDLEGFVRWIGEPAQAHLRRRLSHFAHDPEDWGGRVQAMVNDYIPSDEVAEALAQGRVTPKLLAKHQDDAPAVHGRAAADNLGTSQRSLMIGSTVDRLYKFIGEMPTDRLSRHPFFNSMYKQHVRAAYSARRNHYGEGYKYTQEDADELAGIARRQALHDLRRTLFDISAHSHAAHVMRFVSPFFAAHQEALSRWWRIVGDDPSVARRFTQAFDAPRYLNLVIDEEGEPVKPGAPISVNHRILLQMPEAWGGPSTDRNNPDAQWSKWSISENSFNLILQNGIMNPGVGPIVSVPVEYFAQKYADQPAIDRVARILNPYPPGSPIEAAVPATLKRISAWTYGVTGHDPSLGLGIGAREYNSAMSQNIQDAIVKFQLDNGREPTHRETEDIIEQSGTETNTQMFVRFLWNAGSPAPARPQSKYAVIQQGWYRLKEQAIAEDRDFAWAYAQFKEKYGAAYMPLIYSSSNNPAGVDATAGAVAALKRYRGVLDRVDPALTRAVVGAYGDDLAQSETVMGEFSPEAVTYLRGARMRPGSPDRYYSYDDPRTAMNEQMARRGWQKYGELTGALTAMAQAQGLNSYNDSDKLVAIKQFAVAKLREENYAFDQDYGSFDSTQYDRYLEDMRTVAKSPTLSGDTERTDIKVLQTYIELRDFITTVLDARKTQGLGGPDAEAQAPIRALFSAMVGKLVESNTYFEDHMYNGLIERDPLLMEAAA